MERKRLFDIHGGLRSYFLEAPDPGILFSLLWALTQALEQDAAVQGLQGQKISGRPVNMAPISL